MILLDTNVVSEPIKPVPEPRVLAWLDAQVVETLHLPSPVLGELMDGVERLPLGQRRTRIERTLARMIDTLIHSRVVSFDRRAAELYGQLTVPPRKKGISVSVVDGQIACIAKLHGFTVATRDVDPFLAMGVPVINPWDDFPKEHRRSAAEALAMDGGDDIDVDPSRLT